jgi:hypothetical protein
MAAHAVVWMVDFRAVACSCVLAFLGKRLPFKCCRLAEKGVRFERGGMGCEGEEWRGQGRRGRGRREFFQRVVVVVSSADRSPSLQPSLRVLSYLMAEFLGRWVLVGVLADLCLAVAGARSGGWGGWALAAVWIGFWNAALRPGVLRLGLSGFYVFWALFLAMCVLNGVLFLACSSWLPWAVLPAREGLLWAAVGIGTLSWGLSSRFRAHDGRWHWISYHGALGRRRVRDSNSST